MDKLNGFDIESKLALACLVQAGQPERYKLRFPICRLRGSHCTEISAPFQNRVATLTKKPALERQVRPFSFARVLRRAFTHHAAQQPVDDDERNRDDVVSSFQNNLNPFIHNPKWVACLFIDKSDAGCPQDLDGDGLVRASDLAFVLGAWGPCEGCPMDFNGDGVVDALGQSHF